MSTSQCEHACTTNVVVIFHWAKVEEQQSRPKESVNVYLFNLVASSLLLSFIHRVNVELGPIECTTLFHRTPTEEETPRERQQERQGSHQRSLSVIIDHTRKILIQQVHIH